MPHGNRKDKQNNLGQSKTIITSLMTIQPSYPNLHYYVLNYSLICHYGVDLFFSGLSAEKKKYPPSANSASQAKRAVKNILSHGYTDSETKYTS